MSLHKLKENEDYIINKQGNVVFTSLFHKKRGFCCGNKCLNCPYVESVKGEKELRKEFKS